MKLTINEIIAAVGSYNKLNKEKFNLKTSYKLARLFDTLQKESERYEDLTREAIIKYSKKDENGEPIINKGEQGESVEIEPINQIKLVQEMEELNNSEIEIDDYYFTFDDFGDLSISIDEIKGLLPFIQE
jgi:hypothetical protein